MFFTAASMTVMPGCASTVCAVPLFWMNVIDHRLKSENSRHSSISRGLPQGFRTIKHNVHSRMGRMPMGGSLSAAFALWRPLRQRPACPAASPGAAVPLEQFRNRPSPAAPSSRHSVAPMARAAPLSACTCALKSLRTPPRPRQSSCSRACARNSPRLSFSNVTTSPTCVAAGDRYRTLRPLACRSCQWAAFFREPER